MRTTPIKDVEFCNALLCHSAMKFKMERGPLQAEFAFVQAELEH